MANECARRVAMGRTVKSGRTLDQRSLADIRAEREFVQYITGIGFEWLLEIGKTQVPLALAQEFFTTFRFRHSDDVLSKSIQFRLFGKKLGMSLTEWSVRMGLFTEQQAETGAWLDRDMKQPRAIEEFNYQTAWESITTNAPPYDATRSMGARINRPVLRMAQAFLGCNLLGLERVSLPISPTELYFLWCMKERRKVHLGYWLAHICHMIAGHPELNLNVCHILGEFVKRNLYIFFQGITQTPLCPPPDSFGILCLVKMGLIRMVGGCYYFYDVDKTKGPSPPHDATLTIMDKPTEEEGTKGESTPVKGMGVAIPFGTAEGTPGNGDDQAARMRGIEKMMHQLVESSKVHQAAMALQTSQMINAVRSLEETLRQVEHHRPPLRHKKRKSDSVVATSSAHKHQKHKTPSPTHGIILPPEQGPPMQQSDPASGQQPPARHPPGK